MDLKYELIGCDNNSTDGTAAIASRAGCTVVFEPVNQISRARNRRAGGATGDWLLFIDADPWPTPELMRDVGALVRGSNVIGAGSTIRVVDGPRWFRFVWKSKHRSMRTSKWCPGGFLLCRREAFSSTSIHSGHPAEGGLSYDLVSWLIFGLELTFFHRRAIRDKGFARNWYDAER